MLLGREIGEAARAHGCRNRQPVSVFKSRAHPPVRHAESIPSIAAPSSPLIALNVECGVLLCADSRCREAVTPAAALSSICARSPRLSLPNPPRGWSASTSGTSQRGSTTTRQCHCCWVDRPRSLSSRSSRGFSAAGSLVEGYAPLHLHLPPH
jgi:hypothetical protein